MKGTEPHVYVKAALSSYLESLVDLDSHQYQHGDEHKGNQRDEQEEKPCGHGIGDGSRVT